MSPITSQSRASYRTGWLGGYRLLDLAVTGAMLIGLAVIGLAGAMVIRPTKVSNNNENFTGQDSEISENLNYYPKPGYAGILGQLRLSRSGQAQIHGQDAASGQDGAHIPGLSGQSSE